MRTFPLLVVIALALTSCGEEATPTAVPDPATPPPPSRSEPETPPTTPAPPSAPTAAGDPRLVDPPPDGAPCAEPWWIVIRSTTFPVEQISSGPLVHGAARADGEDGIQLVLANFELPSTAAGLGSTPAREVGQARTAFILRAAAGAIVPGTYHFAESPGACGADGACPDGATCDAASSTCRWSLRLERPTAAFRVPDRSGGISWTSRAEATVDVTVIDDDHVCGRVSIVEGTTQMLGAFAIPRLH